ncbi:MAG: hypothetical protein ACOH5I_10750 [Oligoflexus sp.]
MRQSRKVKTILPSFFLACQLIFVNASLFSCSNLNQENKRHKGEASREGKLADADANVSEPVMVAGGFLICAQFSDDDNSARVGCRIEDHLRNKIPLQNLAGRDLSIIQIRDGEPVVGVVFEVEGDESFWHWSTSFLNFDGRQIRLEKDFGFPIEPKQAEVLDRYPYDAQVAAEEVCQGTLFGGACFYLSQSGVSCESTCASHGGIAPAGFSIYEVNMCSNILDVIGRDPYRQQQATRLPLAFRACGFSEDVLAENIPSGRYVMDPVDDEQGEDPLPTSLVQVCNCLK